MENRQRTLTDSQTPDHFLAMLVIAHLSLLTADLAEPHRPRPSVRLHSTLGAHVLRGITGHSYEVSSLQTVSGIK